MELLKKLFEIYSPSAEEDVMKAFIRRYIKQNIPGCRVWRDKKGNMYVKKGEAKHYPCLAAHLDQVQKNHSRDFQVVEAKGLLFGYSKSKRRQEGLGADDKCGIWIALKCLERYETLKIAFFVEEEVGCRGSSKCNMEFFQDVRFVVEPDRRGKSDLITNIGWTELCSKAFVKTIEPERWGYHEENGMITDVEALKDNGLTVSCINLSCGYYQPHSDQEFVVKDDLQNCLCFVQHIIETVIEPSEHIHEDFYYAYDDSLDELSDIIENTMSYAPETTAEDLMSWYEDFFPHLKLEQYEQAIREWKDYNEPILTHENHSGHGKSNKKNRT